MRIALFGGSFNPPHNGHVAVAKNLVDSKEFDEIWIVPSFRHPFEKSLASFEDRISMCHLAFDFLGPGLKVSEVEREIKSEKGFTIDLLRHLKKQRPKENFSLVMGSDLLMETDQWKDFEGIKKLADFHPIRRSGYEASPFPQVSSTQIREAIARHDDVSTWIPPEVHQYILQKGLYR